MPAQKVYARIDGQKLANTKRGLQDFMPRHKLKGILIKRNEEKFWRRYFMHHPKSTKNNTRKTCTPQKTTLVAFSTLHHFPSSSFIILILIIVHVGTDHLFCVVIRFL